MSEVLHPALIITYEDETKEILKHLEENEEIVDIISDEDLNEDEQKENQ